jgi:hypothetical protein
VRLHSHFCRLPDASGIILVIASTSRSVTIDVQVRFRQAHASRFALFVASDSHYLPATQSEIIVPVFAIVDVAAQLCRSSDHTIAWR